jgi:phage-related protein
LVAASLPGLTFSSNFLIKTEKGEQVPRIRVIFCKEDDGTVPMVEWIEGLPKKPREKCFEWIERLMTFGHELHRPYTDSLRDGIHELRVRYQNVNYRMLYFFHGKTAAVITHGLIKEKRVPDKEIDKAVELKKRFEANPESHTFRWEP